MIVNISSTLEHGSKSNATSNAKKLKLTASRAHIAGVSSADSLSSPALELTSPPMKISPVQPTHSCPSPMQAPLWDFWTWLTTLTEVCKGELHFEATTKVIMSSAEANEVNYYILATDYFQYAVGWGCENLEDDQSKEFVWILSRTPELPETYNERVDGYIDQHFDRTFLRETIQNEEA